MPSILILETDYQMAKTLNNYLTKAGHSVTTYVDPQTAIHAVDKKQPDLVILELILAGHSGVEFLYELRSYPEWQNIPVLITSRLNKEELTSFMPALNQLEIKHYFHKSTTALSEIKAAVDTIFQPIAG